MRHSYLTITAAILLLAGCNTYVQKTHQRVTVRTPGIENAHCTLTTKTNRYDVMTPREAVVERSQQPLTVVCEKTGYDPASVIVKPRIYTPGAPANVFNGIVPGVVYDIASDSVYDYPGLILVMMNRTPQDAPGVEHPYVLPKKPAFVKPAPPPTAPADKAAAEKSMSKSLRK